MDPRAANAIVLEVRARGRIVRMSTQARRPDPMLRNSQGAQINRIAKIA